MMLEVLASLLDTNDVVNSLETLERKIKEMRKHRASGVLQGRHRDPPGRRGVDEDAPHHEFAQVDDVPGHQERRDKCQAGPERGDGKDGRRDGCGCVLEEVVQRCLQRCLKGQRVGGRVLVLREEGPSSFGSLQETN